MNAMLNPNRAKSGSGAPGPKSAPRGSKSTTFANGFFQPFSPLKFFLNPIGESPFYHSHVRYTDETKRKFEKSSASEVGVL